MEEKHEADKDSMVTIEVEIEENFAAALRGMRDRYGYIELELPIGQNGEPVTVKVHVGDKDEAF